MTWMARVLAGWAGMSHGILDCSVQNLSSRASRIRPARAVAPKPSLGQVSIRVHESKGTAETALPQGGGKSDALNRPVEIPSGTERDARGALKVAGKQQQDALCGLSIFLPGACACACVFALVLRQR